MIGLGDRLKELAKRRGISDSDVARLVGISPRRYSHYINDNREPPLDLLLEIASALNSSTDELLGAAHDGTDQHDGTITYDGKTPRRRRQMQGDLTFEGVEYATVPLCDVNVSAGAGLIPVDEGAEIGRLAFTRAWFSRHRINAQLCGLVRVKGDSMAPTLPEGALILVHAAEMYLRSQGVFAFARAGEAFVKRLRPLEPATDGRPTAIVIVSDNPAYAPEVVSGRDLNDIRIVGRVRACMTSIA